MKRQEPDHFREWMEMCARPRHALLVDDSKQDTTLILHSSKGFNVHWESAASGDEALQRIRQRHYDLIVLDLRLGSPPEGEDLFRQIKRISSTAPVLILSGYITTESVAAITKVGFAMFAQKPAVFDSNFFEQLFLMLNIPKVISA